MQLPAVGRILFTISYPKRAERGRHIAFVKLQSLARRQLPDLDVIETIDHLFKCARCFENYRRIRSSQLFPRPSAALD